ncbi:restriction endonuclease [Lichenicoccus sp.]|uniref:restriction endonuclease n=1 Tax=Lichenicoccus sp. TaxID=2781899 RepID=UPI003D0C56B5
MAAAPPAAAATGAAASPRGYALGFVLAVLLIILTLATLALMLRLLLRRAVEPVRPIDTNPRPSAPPPVMLPAAPRASVGLAPRPLAIQEADAPRQCADLLRKAGWQVKVGASVPAGRVDCGRDCHADLGTDLVARRDGRVLALRCPPPAAIVNEEVVEQACIARERERADRAAIVSQSPYPAAARKLAMQTGIDLLEPDQLRAFAR